MCTRTIHSRTICCAKQPKELVIVQGARHLCSAYADPELYQRTVMEFFEKYDGSNSEK